MWCANCHHDGRTTPATWQAKRIAVCDEHKAYHERLAKLPPLSAATVLITGTLKAIASLLAMLLCVFVVFWLVGKID